jgi:hypothetical protein
MTKNVLADCRAGGFIFGLLDCFLLCFSCALSRNVSLGLLGSMGKKKDLNL